MFKSTLLIIICLVFQNCSNNSASSAEENEATIESLEGRWITNCISEESSSYQLIYSITENKENLLLGKIFPSSDSCQGSYNYADIDNNTPTTELRLDSELTQLNIEGIPNNFLIIEATAVLDDEKSYVVFYVGSSNQLHLFTDINTNAGSRWSEWLDNQATLASFVDDPENSNLSNVFHLSPSSDPICSLEGTWINCRTNPDGTLDAFIYTATTNTLTYDIVTLPAGSDCEASVTEPFEFQASYSLGTDSLSTFIEGGTDLDFTPGNDYYSCGIGNPVYTTIKFTDGCTKHHIADTDPSCSANERGNTPDDIFNKL